MRPTSALLPLGLVGSTYAAAIKSASCADLWNKAPELLSNLEVYVAQDYPGPFTHSLCARPKLELTLYYVLVAAGTNFTAEPAYASPAYPQAVPDLPAFCRFGAYIHTSKSSKVRRCRSLSSLFYSRGGLADPFAPCRSSSRSSSRPPTSGAAASPSSETVAMQAVSTTQTCGHR